jgi:hypothetical protein
MHRLQTGLNIPFSEFWRRYLAAHQRAGTRAMHYAATAVGIAFTLVAIHQRDAAYMLGGISLGYCMAVGSHWAIEGNQPLIRVNAFYGALADLRMCWLAFDRQPQEGVPPPRPDQLARNPGPFRDAHVRFANAAWSYYWSASQTSSLHRGRGLLRSAIDAHPAEA